MGQAWNVQAQLLPTAFRRPITDKWSGDDAAESLGLAWGFSEMQGWRDEMEDAHIAAPSLGRLVGSRACGWDNTAIFGVMDGHGGDHVANFCEQHLPLEIAQGPSLDPCRALIAGFQQVDEMLADPSTFEELRKLSSSCIYPWEEPASGTGCTAVVCCVRKDMIFCANAGDSRAVLCRRGKAVELSTDHAPTLPEEYARIAKAGGWVDDDLRVVGDLNLSRCIGDLQYKQNLRLPPSMQIISSTPDVRTLPRDHDDEFMIIGCDGIWDGISSQNAVDFVRKRLGTRSSWRQRIAEDTIRVSSIVEELLDHCMSKDPFISDGLSGDNMTAILVIFVEPPLREAAPQWSASALPAESGVAGSPLRQFRPQLYGR